MRLLLALLLVLLIVGLLPSWPYAAGWGIGYYPSGLLTLVLLIIVIMAVSGRRGSL